MANYKYGFRVFWSDEDNAYVAMCPELPGVSALGESEDEALREAKAALELYIEDVLESGEALPEAQTARDYSGQTRLRMSKTLHRSAAQMADDEGISLNQYCVDAIQAKVASEQAARRFISEITRVITDEARHSRTALQLVEQRLTHQMAQHSTRLASYMDMMEGRSESITASMFGMEGTAREGYRIPRTALDSFRFGGGELGVNEAVWEDTIG